MERGNHTASREGKENCLRGVCKPNQLHFLMACPRVLFYFTHLVLGKLIRDTHSWGAGRNIGKVDGRSWRQSTPKSATFKPPKDTNFCVPSLRQQARKFVGPAFLILGFFKSCAKLSLTGELKTHTKKGCPAYAPLKAEREAQKFSVVALAPSHQGNTSRRQKGYGSDKESPAYWQTRAANCMSPESNSDRVFRDNRFLWKYNPSISASCTQHSSGLGATASPSAWSDLWD